MNKHPIDTYIQFSEAGTASKNQEIFPHGAIKGAQFWWDGAKFSGVGSTRPAVCEGVSRQLGFGPIHEGFDPGRAINELRRGNNVLHPAVLHLREETESGYFCVRHSSEEENQCCSTFPLLPCNKQRDAFRQEKREKTGYEIIFNKSGLKKMSSGPSVQVNPSAPSPEIISIIIFTNQCETGL